MPKRILVLAQWFDPEPAPKSGLQFALALRDRGFEVEVATGFPNYPTGRIMPGYRLRPYTLEVMQGIRVHRLFLYPSHSKSSIGRALNYLSFFMSSLLFGLMRGRKFDAVYVHQAPIMSAVAAALAGMVWRRPYLMEAQDLWPDSVAVSGFRGSRWITRILGPVSNFGYRRAALVIGQSTTMTRTLVERGVDPARAVTFFNWIDEDAARPGGGYDVGSLRFAGRFNFVYGGNLGTVQDLETLVHAAIKAATTVPAIQLTLIGDGVERKRLEQLVGAVGGATVQLFPPVAQSQIGDVFAAADVLVLHLLDRQLFEVTIPSKTQFYMATGKPILAAVRGEARDIVISAGAGLSAEPGDIDSIAGAMVEMARMPPADLARMGASAHQAYMDRFSFERTMGELATAIDRLVPERE